MRHSARALSLGGLVLAVGAAVTTGLAVPAQAGSELVPGAGSGAGHGEHRVLHHQRGVKAASGGAAAASSLAYRGAVDGIGVTVGAPKVYLVFWGSQWGTATTTAGLTTFSNDPKGVAPQVEKMLAGLGTNGEQWSGVMTQYCEGIAAGSTSCPSNAAARIGYPTGGALAGVLYDNSLEPTTATGAQLAQVAVNAATTFGNTTAASNRNAQYVVVSSTGLHPNGFNTASANWCAWHDWNGDWSVPSTVGDVAFTNLPYLPDMGASCGANYVNAGAAGALDGVTIVEGHEYAETITDQNPAGGWTDSTGYENGDKCSWIGTGGSGGAQNVTFATGTFAMQGTWANDVAGCLAAHATVVSTSNTVTVTAPASQTNRVGTAITPVQVSAVDSLPGQTLTYSATGLPAGLAISAAGVISGTPTTAKVSTVTVKATDSLGAYGTASFTWTVQANVVTVTNPGAQSTARSTVVSLQIHATDSNPSATLTYSATNLPTGLSINASTGLISGKTSTSAASKSVKVTVRDNTGISGSASFTWRVV